MPTHLSETPATHGQARINSSALSDYREQPQLSNRAPFAWTVAANKKVQNPWPVKTLPSGLTQSVMGDLYFDYTSTDYSRLRSDREAYQKMLAELRAVAPKLPKPKNHAERN